MRNKDIIKIMKEINALENNVLCTLINDADDKVISSERSNLPPKNTINARRLWFGLVILVGALILIINKLPRSAINFDYSYSLAFGLVGLGIALISASQNTESNERGLERSWIEFIIRILMYIITLMTALIVIQIIIHYLATKNIGAQQYYKWYIDPTSIFVGFHIDHLASRLLNIGTK